MLVKKKPMIFFSHPNTLALKFDHFPVFLHKGFNKKIKTVKKKNYHHEPISITFS